MHDKPEIPNHVLANILAAVDEGTRLGQLSKEALVREVLEHEGLDHPLVIELVTRVWPEWLDELAED